MCNINISKTSVVVISPKSHGAASPFNACQNWERVSPVCCILEKNLCQSRVRFLFFQKHSLHISVSSLTFNDHNVTWGNLSLNCFLAASPSDRYNTLTTFLLADSSSKSPISARTLGFCWDVSLVNSVREIEYFAVTATWNKSTHLYHSIVGLNLASCQKTGGPTRWDNDDDWIVEG